LRWPIYRAVDVNEHHQLNLFIINFLISSRILIYFMARMFWLAFFQVFLFSSEWKTQFGFQASKSIENELERGEAFAIWGLNWEVLTGNPLRSIMIEGNTLNIWERLGISFDVQRLGVTINLSVTWHSPDSDHSQGKLINNWPPSHFNWLTVESFSYCYFEIGNFKANLKSRQKPLMKGKKKWWYFQFQLFLLDALGKEELLYLYKISDPKNLFAYE